MKTIILIFIPLLVILTTGCNSIESDSPGSAECNGCNSIESDSSGSAKGEWKLVRKSSDNGFYQGLSFADQNSGWAVGDSGRILHTNDGGNSWNIQESRKAIYLKCVYFANPQRGWIGGSNNSIGVTTDGGVTWTWQHPAGESHRTFMAMSLVNEHTGWIVDNYSGILHTEDAGITWTPQTSGTTWAITSVQFLDAKEGWATATNRVVLHTTDGGNNWITSMLDALDYGGDVTVIYTDIFFCNHCKGWIATDAGASNIGHPLAPIVYTSDAGSNWICQPSPDSGINSIKFVNKNLGWAAGLNGILYTTDAGTNWTYQLEITNGWFVDLCFVDQLHGWAITFDGNIYRYQAS